MAIELAALPVELLLQSKDVLIGARNRPILFNWVVVWVHLHREHVLCLKFRHVQVVKVFQDKTKLGAEDVGILIFCNSFVGSSHDRNDHVKDDKKRDKRADKEDEPEDENVVRVLGIVFTCDLEISQSEPVRVDEAISKAS